MPTLAIGNPDDKDFMTDLEAVVRRVPGCGPALQRLLDRAGVTQTALAERLNVVRTAVTHWCKGDRFPDQDTLRRVFEILNLDRVAVLRVVGLRLNGEQALEHLKAQTDPQAALVTVTEFLAAMEQDDDGLERRKVICRVFDEKVLIAMGLRALNGDARAAKLYFERSDQTAADNLRRQNKETRSVTSEQEQWAEGNVYEDGDEAITAPDEAGESSVSV